nr:immunoglobulin light chain junction region [Macaca mulatta]
DYYCVMWHNNTWLF